jgi:UDP-galactopyranose mutase
LETEDVAHNVCAVRPHLRATYPFYIGQQVPPLLELIQDFVARRQIEPVALWFYTPMALPVAQTFDPLAVAYDCMDALASFRYAPPEMREREAELLQWADVVFTGGPSLYKAKVGQHTNLHCFPSSIDVAHFRGAREPGLQDPPNQAPIPQPRLGYFGVVDERLDYDLLAALAGARPDWQIVIVGPFAKVNPEDLPRATNLHYLGQQAYEDLPAYINGWDVALMPFALNEATRFISPTKTLEYMAAGRAIVSTPITDVREPYGDIVYIADNGDTFVAACEQALNASPVERLQRQRKGDEVLARTSWDDTANRMHTLLDDAVQRRSLRAFASGSH